MIVTNQDATAKLQKKLRKISNISLIKPISISFIYTHQALNKDIYIFDGHYESISLSISMLSK